METCSSIYVDIASRTGGEIYVGVVGPVRTGKSTFIKRFMEELVLPESSGARRQRMTDELPQSAAGKTVMTTEPKFVPETAAEITVGSATVKLRLVDCVGFPVSGAGGFEEEGTPRLVNTPWSDRPVTFEEAAAEGTRRVIREHSTVGVLVTSDGSFTGIGRESYAAAEEETVRELKEIGKPFVIVLNCSDASAEQTLAAELTEKYGVPVLSMNVETAKKEELASVLERILYEFPVLSFDVDLPDWVRVLGTESPLVKEVLNAVRKIAPKICKMSDCALLDTLFQDSERLLSPVKLQLEPAKGYAKVTVEAREGAFYAALSEQCGTAIDSDFALMAYVASLSEAKKLYDRAGKAFADAKEYGYGVVPPESADMSLAEPKLVRRSGRVGVNLRADCPSYHIIRVDLSGEVSPAVGNEQQSEEFVGEISRNLASCPEQAWNTNMFGKTLREMLGEELSQKNRSMGENVQRKMRRTVNRIVNEGKGGVICILL